MSGSAGEGGASSRPFFGSLLRRWRRHRRVSQLELSLRAGISQRHLSFLESGRAGASRRAVLQVAEALEVPVRERNVLLRAAGYSALYGHRALSEQEMAPVRQALELMLTHHEPYPAMAVDDDWNLLLGNAALSRMLGVLGDPDTLWRQSCGEGPRNVMRLTLHPAGLRPYIANWEEAAPMLVLRLEREPAASGSAATARLLAEICADPGIPRRWREPDLERALPPLLPLVLEAHGTRLRLFSTDRRAGSRTRYLRHRSTTRSGVRGESRHRCRARRARCRAQGGHCHRSPR